ncbi:CARDB domain-containing protein [Haloprofundus sp. MHR1]|uniref:CARDB domain-containing protein n=1 Tax=Haloprofundus sp. MHR1 TaxID=2572921 RepID=UPI0010BE7E06|nr:CARDB domain-containing protein [Haloprofundus sp. MHR1]QCJ45959.1 hypothetical protein FCF25_01960 [Haloprofundus sp. MHR1]
MSATRIPDLLTAFATAVESENFEQASSRLDELQAAYSDVKQDEEIRARKALRVRNTNDVSAKKRDQLESLARSHISVSLSRTGILTYGGIFETSPENVKPDELVGTARELGEKEEQFQKQAAEVDPVLDEAQIDPSVEIVQTTTPNTHIPKGETVSIPVTLMNIGDAVASDVSIDGNTKLPVSPDEESIGELAAEEQARSEFTLTADRIGEFTLTFKVSSENAGSDTKTVTLSVAGKADFIATARQVIEGIREEVTTELSGGQARSFEEKLTAVLKSLERATNECESGREKQANNAIGTAINQLGAVLNSFAALQRGAKKAREKSLSEQFVQGAVRQTENAIETLATARTAELAE